jgi:hypothetical protein
MAGDSRSHDMRARNRIDRLIDKLEALQLSKKERIELARWADPSDENAIDADDMQAVGESIQTLVKRMRDQRNMYRYQVKELKKTVDWLYEQLKIHANMVLPLMGMDDEQSEQLRSTVINSNKAILSQVHSALAESQDYSFYTGVFEFYYKKTSLTAHIRPGVYPGSPDNFLSETGTALQNILDKTPFPHELKYRTIPGIDSATMQQTIGRLNFFVPDSNDFMIQFEREFEQIWMNCDQTAIDRDSARDRFRKSFDETYKVMQKNGRVQPFDLRRKPGRKPKKRE